jgi:CRP-like cAMP-binding protein
MPTEPLQTGTNQLLNALPEADWLRWQPALESVELRQGEVLYEAGSLLSHAYFPSSAIISLVYVMDEKTSGEIAVVGFEGLVGISLLMGGDSSVNRAVVQRSGHCYRISAALIRAEFNRSSAVMELLLRYTQAVMTQMSQTAVCNRHHTLDQQLCRWLLLSLDRRQSLELHITQVLIARLLGVRREGVTEAALKLQQLGLIRYARGHITVLDRPGLERRSCECYGVVKQEYDRLLNSPSAGG